MRKYYSTFLVLCSLIIYSNTLAASLLDDLLEAAEEAKAERERMGPVLSVTLIPQAKNQSQLGSYLVEQLTIKSKEEKNKGKAKKIKNDIRRIEKSLRNLNEGISGWEKKDYTLNLDKLITTFSKHTKRHKNIVEVERNRLAALEKARLEELAALEKVRLEKLAAFIERCEPGAVADDPFAAFNAAQEPRMDLVLKIGSSKMKLEATKNGNCMWLGNYNRPDVIPALVEEKHFNQNPNNKAQYSLEIDTNGKRPAVTSIKPGIKFGISIPGQFMLDFENYMCTLVKQDGSRQQISCDDGRPCSFPENINTVNCDCVNQLSNLNYTSFMERYGVRGASRLAECTLR